MNKKKTSLIANLCCVGLSGLFAATVHADDDVLTSVRAGGPVVVDGVVDHVWTSAKAVHIELDQTLYEPSNGYPGMASTTVEMKSLYDDKNIYFLLQYTDPTHSFDRFPWIKQSDGSWQQKMNKDSTGHDNYYYEDKVAIFWNISADKFENKGCAVACHRASGGKVNGIDDSSVGRKFTREGETIDMWHWKSVRTNPNHQLDDQFVDSTHDPKQNKEWGRKGDHKTGGGYKDNVERGKPAYVSANLNETSVAIPDAAKRPFTPYYNGSTRIPGIVTAPFEGSRGDIEGYGVWRDGVWTLEIKRAKVTEGQDAALQDVQFSDPKGRYPFGVAVFDNSQINHIFHFGSYVLEFE
ncbi:MAG: ethylbenzene dehydrogenase [Hahellaceae bacterium]|nr:ethylbenzene dehydrogenase [Hahellaceae bacterium]MCP5169798.1 ethylbenzene dehydrogenase [Hahellaceae bacterium]